MPKNNNLKSILIIGSGPIIIGQACEFDYSGTQALRSLHEDGIETILINSNPATIMTDPSMADHVYLLPLTSSSIIKILKEHPQIDAVQVSPSFLNIIFENIYKNPNIQLNVDLPNQLVSIPDLKLSESFSINDYKKNNMLNGYDDIDYLINMKETITKFAKNTPL